MSGMDIEWMVEQADGTVTEFKDDVHKAVEFNMSVDDGELLWRYRTKWRKASEELPF